MGQQWFMVLVFGIAVGMALIITQDQSPTDIQFDTIPGMAGV